METEKNKNNSSTLVITVLSVILVALIGYIGYDKLLNKENPKQTTTQKTQINNANTKVDVKNTTKEENNIRLTGECPLTKFNNSYILTDTDKEEILDSLESLNAGFTRQNIDINSLTVSKVSESGYYLNVKLGDGIFAEVAKVNDKVKVLMAGSGDTIEGIKRMEYTLQRICS